MFMGLFETGIGRDGVILGRAMVWVWFFRSSIGRGVDDMVWEGQGEVVWYFGRPV